MSGNLVITPAGMTCGDLSVGMTFNFQWLIQNDGDEPLVITDITSNSADIALGFGGPITVNPGDNDGYPFTITPTGPGAAVVTFVSDAVNSPTTVSIFWTVAGAGTKQLTVNPAGWNFPDTKIGVDSAEKLFTVSNSGTVDVTVSAITFSTDFLAGATVAPAFPDTLHPGNSFTFGIKFHPLGIGYTSENVAIVSDAAATPFNIVCTGICFGVNSAFVITSGRQSLLFALAFPEGVPGVNPSVMIPPNPITWACEEDGNIDNTFMLPFPTEQGAIPGFSYEKQIPRVLFHYEDYGVCVVRVSLTSERGQIVFKDVTIGTVGADLQTKLAFADVNITDEIHTISFEANGPFFLVDYIIKYVPKGEKKA